MNFQVRHPAPDPRGPQLVPGGLPGAQHDAGVRKGHRHHQRGQRKLTQKITKKANYFYLKNVLSYKGKVLQRVGGGKPADGEFGKFYFFNGKWRHDILFQFPAQPSCLRPEFKHTSAKELDSFIYSAGMDTYGGGGYVYR